MTSRFRDIEKSLNKNLYLLLISLLVGIAAGFFVSFYRFVLTEAEEIARYFYGKALHAPLYLFLIIPMLILLAALITFLMKRYPIISGSGIPQVKGQLLGYFKPAWFSTACSKFIAGSLAMLGGLSLGREGPSIQLGATMGQALGEKFAATENHKRLLIASGASAGLAAAFNAPLSGVMFTLEEVFRYFSSLILLTSMTAAVTSDAISRLIFGPANIFHFHLVHVLPIKYYGFLLILGLILGFFGAIYNWTLLHSQKWMKQIKQPFLQVLLSFLAVAAMGLVFPLVIGSGHSLISQMTFGWSLGFLALVLISKFFISIISYASGVPGGIFFPLLVLGASLGALYATFVIQIFHIPSVFFANLVIIAMTGTFTAIVRAPMTGILLLVEMTGNFSNLLPLALVSVIAYVVADLVHSEPIYDTLLGNLLRGVSPTLQVEDEQIMFEALVEFGAPADNKLLRDLKFPDECLILTIDRGEEHLIPKGSTKILAGDRLTLMISGSQEAKTRQEIGDLLSTRAD